MREPSQYNYGLRMISIIVPFYNKINQLILTALNLQIDIEHL